MKTSRRRFLTSLAGGSAVLSLSGPVPTFLAQAAAAESNGKKDTILVVVQLTGGIGVDQVVEVGGAGTIAKSLGAYVVFVYQVGSVTSHTTLSCTITITAPGSASTAATGTFSAMLMAGDGTKKRLTNGAFSAVPKISN